MSLFIPETVARPASNETGRPTATKVKASILIVNTNELHHLKRCLPSIFNQLDPDVEVLIIDNGSSDGSLEYVQEHFPQARIIKNESNLGYTGANNVGFRHAQGEFIAVLNPDTEVQPNWLEELIKALEQNPNAGLVTPKILLMDSPERINTCGNEITFTGLTVCRGLEEPRNHYSNVEIVSAVSGAAFVIRKSLVDKLGGFDESLFIYYEETDLSLRAMLAGYKCLYVPSAIVYHKYTFKFSAKKCFYQERNRYFALIKTFHWATLLALIPGVIISEIISWGYAGLRGPAHLSSKLQSFLWLIRHRKEILESRRQVQSLRKVADKAILQNFGYHLNFAQTTNPGLAAVLAKTVNPVIFLIGKFTRAVVAW